MASETCLDTKHFSILVLFLRIVSAREISPGCIIQAAGVLFRFQSSNLDFPLLSTSCSVPNLAFCQSRQSSRADPFQFA
jgi:hypothetical protein